MALLMNKRLSMYFTGAGGTTMDEHKESKVRERAYQLFLERGNRAGDAVEDWLSAEKQISDAERPGRGPARIRDTSHHGTLADAHGCDIENPT